MRVPDRISWDLRQRLRAGAKDYLFAFGGFVAGVLFTSWMLG